MTVAAHALVTLPEARSFLRITGSAEDGAIEEAINRASRICEHYCDRPLKKETFTNVRLRGPRRCELKDIVNPIDVTAAVTVTVNGVVQTVWRTEADGDPGTFDVACQSDVLMPALRPNLLFRAGGWLSSTTNHWNVLLTYTGGFATVPDDLLEACLLVVQKLFRDQQRQLSEVVSIDTPAGGVTLLDSWLPRRAKSTLDLFYRRRSV